MVRTFLFAVSLGLVGIAPVSGLADSALYSKAKKSAAIIIVKINALPGADTSKLPRHEKRGKPINYGGSGVIFGKNKDLVLSNYHILKDRVSESSIACAATGSMKGRFMVKNEEGDAFFNAENQCEILAADPGNDLVVLKRKKSFGSEASSISFASADIAIGDPVFGVFAPNFVAGTWYESYVNNIIERPSGGIEGLQSEFNLPIAFGYSAPTAAGASGSMVLDRNGKLVGVTFAEVYNLGTGLGIPVSIIKNFLSAKLPKEDIR